MTAPIPVFEGATISGGRRTERGACYLTPNPEVANIILYLALYYAQKHDLRLLVFCVMSNHIHWVADDPTGSYPDFLRDFHARVTEVLNDHHDHEGPIWANCPPHRARCLDDATVEEKMLYAATNPPWHGITPRAKAWPGLFFTPENAGETIRATCPDYLARRYNCFANTPTISYVVPVPQIYRGMTIPQCRAHFRARRLAREKRLQIQRDKPYLGVDFALQAGPETIPAPKDDPRDLSNDVIATSGDRDEAYEALSNWRSLYYQAREKFLAGERDVRWPRGTYAMKRLHNCPCRKQLT